MEPTQEQAYQRRIAELEAENADLKALVAELKPQVARLAEQVAKLSTNSSKGVWPSLPLRYGGFPLTMVVYVAGPDGRGSAHRRGTKPWNPAT